MPETKCGFDNQPAGSGSYLLATWGPTLLVDIGFDPDFKITVPASLPKPGITNVEALVDTGAAECCIDSLLAAQLQLPVVDKRPIGGIGGQQIVNMHLAQIHVPTLKFNVYGLFAGVHLATGGQRHKALMGRSFLVAFTMVYEGATGTVTISS